MQKEATTNFLLVSITSEHAPIFLRWGTEGGGRFVVMTLIAQANEISRMEDRIEIQNQLNQTKISHG